MKGGITAVPLSGRVATWTGQILREGDRGQYVSDLQRMLNKVRFDPGPIDGIFGNQTRSAVLRFQRATGIKVDGLAGTQTYRKLTQKAPWKETNGQRGKLGSGIIIKGKVYKDLAYWTVNDFVNVINDHSIPIEDKGIIMLRLGIEGILISKVPSIVNAVKEAGTKSFKRLGDLKNFITSLIRGKVNFSNANFGSQRLLDNHYQKHVIQQKEFGNITKNQYLQRARNLLNSTSKGNILTKTRTNGDIIVYNRATNEFAVGSKDGVIRTYFKPRDGIDYFNRQ